VIIIWHRNCTDISWSSFWWRYAKGALRFYFPVILPSNSFVCLYYILCSPLLSSKLASFAYWMPAMSPSWSLHHDYPIFDSFYAQYKNSSYPCIQLYLLGIKGLFIHSTSCLTAGIVPGSLLQFQSFNMTCNLLCSYGELRMKV